MPIFSILLFPALGGERQELSFSAVINACVLRVMTSKRVKTSVRVHPLGRVVACMDICGGCAPRMAATAKACTWHILHT